MNKLILVALTLAATPALAETSRATSALQILQAQLATPQAQAVAAQATQSAQQAVVQQALQQLAANPQLLTSMVNSLSPQQQATLMQQALTVGQQVFTQKEQAKLLQFTSSPEGASIAAKMPQLVQQLAPTVLQMVAAQQSGASVTPAAGK